MAKSPKLSQKMTKVKRITPRKARDLSFRKLYTNVVSTALSILLILLKTTKTSREALNTMYEMFRGETNVTVLTDSTIEPFISKTNPHASLVSFTKLQCVTCIDNDYQLVILADNYAKRSEMANIAKIGKNVKIGVICIKEHDEVAERHNIHSVPEVRLYYRGMYQIYDHGNDFTLLNRFVEGHLGFHDILLINDAKTFWKKLDGHRHALIWFGDEIPKIDHRLQEFFRLLYFRFSHTFYLFKTTNEVLGNEFGLEKHKLYEWNHYDSKFTEIDIFHLLEDNRIDLAKFQRVATSIEHNSYRKINFWSPKWIKTHPHTDFLLFYTKQRLLTPEQHKLQEIFNQTCEEEMFKRIHCVIFDHAENEDFSMESIFYLQYDHIGETALVVSKWYPGKHEIFVKNLTSSYLDATAVHRFFEQVEAKEVEQYVHLNEELPKDNEKRLIKVINTRLLWEYWKDHSRDTMIVVHDGEATDASIEVLELYKKAVGFIAKDLRKKGQNLPKINFGTLDCSKNDCFYSMYFGDTLGPVVVYFKAWEHRNPVTLEWEHFHFQGNLLGRIVMLAKQEYTMGDVDLPEWPLDREKMLVKEVDVHKYDLDLDL